MPSSSGPTLGSTIEQTATLTDGEDPVEATKLLQSQAEGLVEDHKQGLLKSSNELYQMTEQQAELRRLQQQLERSQAGITEICARLIRTLNCFRNDARTA